MMSRGFTWLSGPVITRPPTYREQLIESMANSLREAGTAACEQDAIRSLFGNGYSMFDIANLLPDARALVFQDLVGEEMSKP